MVRTGGSVLVGDGSIRDNGEETFGGGVAGGDVEAVESALRGTTVQSVRKSLERIGKTEIYS